MDDTTNQWKAVNRSSPEHVDDVLLTMVSAPGVIVLVRPDIAGTYQMLVTVVDACNSTVQAITNVTVLCSHAPVARLKDGTAGEQPWRQKAAMAEVSETYALGWWPSHVLDATPSFLEDTDEQFLAQYTAARDARLAAAAAAAAAALGVPPAVTKRPEPGNVPPPPPPTFRPLSSLDEWKQWTTAPRWNMPFRESDGVLYTWKLMDAPHGSNAWRRQFKKGVNDTGNPVRFDPSGSLFLQSVAPEADPTPLVVDSLNYVASFQPDVVGTYGFKLDLSNTCYNVVANFEVSFVCNAAPKPRLSATPQSTGMCLARQEVTSTSTDADGDEVTLNPKP